MAENKTINEKYYELCYDHPIASLIIHGVAGAAIGTLVGHFGGKALAKMFGPTKVPITVVEEAPKVAAEIAEAVI